MTSDVTHDDGNTLDEFIVVQINLRYGMVVIYIPDVAIILGLLYPYVIEF